MPPIVNKWITQLYTMVNDNNDKSVLDWSTDNNGFVIKDYNKFVSKDGILFKYYPRAKSYSSFIRSLSYYNFVMDLVLSSSNVKVYSHLDKLFQKGCHDNLSLIIRKSTVDTKQRVIDTLSSIKKKRGISDNKTDNKPKSKKIKQEKKKEEEEEEEEIIEEEDYYFSSSSDSEYLNINIERSNAISPNHIEITEQEYQNDLIEDYDGEDDEEENNNTQTTLDYSSDATVAE
jgi:hypothetical protein